MNAKRRKATDIKLEKAAKACAERGAQLTKLRRLVLKLILEAEGPTTAYRLLDRLRASHQGAVPPTVYRALDFLMEQRLIHKVERLNAFIACSDTDHPHAVQFLICRQCGTVAEMEDRAAERALERAAQREGFHLANAVVEIEGTCATCSEAA
jgi:Fur family transcriptional regulator, zinc uptake regulator